MDMGDGGGIHTPSSMHAQVVKKKDTHVPMRTCTTAAKKVHSCEQKGMQHKEKEMHVCDEKKNMQEQEKKKNMQEQKRCTRANKKEARRACEGRKGFLSEMLPSFSAFVERSRAARSG